jgi:hypothetical protein
MPVCVDNMTSLTETLLPVASLDYSYFKTLCIRAERCRETPISKKEWLTPNCFGSALYMINEQEEDAFVHPVDDAPKYLSRLERVSAPQLGGMIIWQRSDNAEFRVCHAALITSFSPLLITDRTEYAGAFIENHPIDSTADYYGRVSKVEAAFYVPECLSQKEEEAKAARQPPITALKSALGKLCSRC